MKNTKWVEELYANSYDADRHEGNETVIRTSRVIEILAENGITQTQQDTLEKVVKVIKKHRPVFFKGDLHSLLSQDEAMRVREVLRIEILEELGIDCTKMRQTTKKKKEGGGMKKPHLVIGPDGTAEIVGVKNPDIIKPKRGKDGKLYFKYETIKKKKEAK